ncbi:hypothetical protein ACS0TY_006872 [Phlomoides rotata]
MLGQKQAEEAIISTFNETEDGGDRKAEEGPEEQPIISVKNMLWHGGSAWDAWFSCASNQKIQTGALSPSLSTTRSSVIVSSPGVVDQPNHTPSPSLALPLTARRRHSRSSVVINGMYP